MKPLCKCEQFYSPDMMEKSRCKFAYFPAEALCGDSERKPLPTHFAAEASDYWYWWGNDYDHGDMQAD